MQWSCRPELDDAFLDELLLSESSRTVQVVASLPVLKSTMELPRKRGGKKNKTSNYPLNSPSRVVRQALFPSGPGSYPSQITPLYKPQEGGQHKSVRQQSETSAFNFPSEQKWREMGWNTSSPAEYLLQANSKDYQQTLAYAEDLRQRQDLQNFADETLSTTSPAKTFGLRGGNFPRSSSFSHTTSTATTRGIAEVGSAQTEEERTLLKNTMLREGLLTKLHELIEVATPHQSLLQPRIPRKEPVFDVSKGTEVLHLLLQLRDTGVLVVESILRWHELRIRLAPMVPLVPFRFENHNYCVKMISDLNFLSTIKTLGVVFGVNPSTMQHNPFMMPAPIPERDFRGLHEQSWRNLRLFSSKDDVVQRVADAEKYLVWCLVHLQDAPPCTIQAASPVHGNNSPTSSSLRKQEQQKLTWQKRAEKQLEMLSMPLESLSGPTYVMDSSKMMKRKGMLPSLPQSPPKTLRELINNVQLSGGEEDYGHHDNNRSKILCNRWHGEDFSANGADFEALGALDAPPHHMVTLVTASVLILLSPADQLPKDLSWRSCQKMLQHGKRLMQRIHNFEVTSVQAFKWKALVPFLQNQHFQPQFLAQFSSAASCLCAWVFSVLRAAQQQDYERLGVRTNNGLDADGDEDRLVLLSELEVDAAANPQSSMNSPTSWKFRENNGTSLPPLSQSRSGKSVRIGNAEVLFINENEPVTSTSRGSSRSSSRQSQSPAVSDWKSRFTVSSLTSDGSSNALLRTSPWTYRGVVYFVSFFLQQDQNSFPQQERAEGEAVDDCNLRRLMIKMYEPMSSVESQMAVDAADLRQDFGDEALMAFESGQYRTLCDLILRHLDRMMGGDERKIAPPPPEKIEKVKRMRVKRKLQPSEQKKWLDESLVLQNNEETNALDLLRQESESNQDGDVENEPVTIEESSLVEESLDRLEPLQVSVLKIQCAARQQRARGKVNRVRAQKKEMEKLEASVLRIQCAARQKQARYKVNTVRVDKQQQMNEVEMEITANETVEEEIVPS